MNKKIIFLLLLISLVVVGCGQGSMKGVPQSVVDKYDELEEKYYRPPNDWTGARLEKCIQSDKTIYVVFGYSTGGGNNFYYNEQGDEFERFSWTDSPPWDEPFPSIPPINTADYDCEVIKSTKK